MLRYVILYYVTLYYINYVMLRYIILYYIILYYIILYYIILYYTVSTFVRKHPRRYCTLRFSSILCTTSLCNELSTFSYLTLLLHTHKMSVMCKKLIMFYALLFDICSLMPTACGLQHAAMLSMTATYLRKNR